MSSTNHFSTSQELFEGLIEIVFEESEDRSRAKAVFPTLYKTLADVDRSGQALDQQASTRHGPGFIDLSTPLLAVLSALAFSFAKGFGQRIAGPIVREKLTPIIDRYCEALKARGFQAEVTSKIRQNLLDWIDKRDD